MITEERAAEKGRARVVTGNSQRPADRVGSSPEEVPGPKVFVSYRRSDTGDVAEGLSARLRRDLGGSNVFRDEEDLIAGRKWRDALTDAIGVSNAAMFLIGPGWTGASDDGTRRIDDDGDPVRNEARQALSNATSCQPLPVLIDRSSPPASLPADVASLFDHHAVIATRKSLRRSSSRDYQGILVGVWESIRQRTRRGVLIIGDHDASAKVDGLVAEMQKARQIDARRLSRFASGACVVSARRLRKGARKWPDVIVLLNADEPTETLRSRIQALKEHPSIRAVALVGVGAAGLAAGYTGAQMASGPASASGSATSFTAASEVSAILPRVGTGPVGGLVTAWSNAAATTKIVLAAGAVAVAGVFAVAASGIVGNDGSSGVEVGTYAVPATSNIFAAVTGAPSDPGGGGPGTPPIEVPITSGDDVTVVVLSGETSCCSGLNTAGGDGQQVYSTAIPPANGVSGISADRHMFLVGVFLGDNVSTGSVPESLDFGSGGLRIDFARLSPEARQLFFVGKGVTSSGQPRVFSPPRGATRLLLGFADALGLGEPHGYYADNVGELTVQVTTRPS